MVTKRSLPKTSWSRLVSPANRAQDGKRAKDQGQRSSLAQVLSGVLNQALADPLRKLNDLQQMYIQTNGDSKVGRRPDSVSIDFILANIMGYFVQI